MQVSKKKKKKNPKTNENKFEKITCIKIILETK
jgi:hypothetical protein